MPNRFEGPNNRHDTGNIDLSEEWADAYIEFQECGLTKEQAKLKATEYCDTLRQEYSNDDATGPDRLEELDPDW